MKIRIEIYHNDAKIDTLEFDPHNVDSEVYAVFVKLYALLTK